MTTSAPKQLQSTVRNGYHAWLAQRGTVSFENFEHYVQMLCRYATLEIAADRLCWSYELPSDPVMKGWFNKFNIAQANSRLEK